jgi:hypothetical protein
MGMTTIILKAGQQPTREELNRARQEIRAATKLPPVYDPDCPPSSPAALAEFAAKARELRRGMKRTMRAKPAVAAQ